MGIERRGAAIDRLDRNRHAPVAHLPDPLDLADGQIDVHRRQHSHRRQPMHVRPVGFPRPVVVSAGLGERELRVARCKDYGELVRIDDLSVHAVPLLVAQPDFGVGADRVALPILAVQVIVVHDPAGGLHALDDVPLGPVLIDANVRQAVVKLAVHPLQEQVHGFHRMGVAGNHRVLVCGARLDALSPTRCARRFKAPQIVFINTAHSRAPSLQIK